MRWREAVRLQDCEMSAAKTGGPLLYRIINESTAFEQPTQLLAYACCSDKKAVD
jgi:hypothetical protein